MENKNISAKDQESDYDYLKRIIGPGTWIYEILQSGTDQKKDWDLLEMKLKVYENDEKKQRAIAKSFRFNRSYWK